MSGGHVHVLVIGPHAAFQYVLRQLLNQYPVDASMEINGNFKYGSSSSAADQSDLICCHIKTFNHFTLIKEKSFLFINEVNITKIY